MAFSHSGTTSVGKTGDDRIDGLLAGYRWTDNTLLYSVPNSPGDYGGDYFTDFNGNGVSAQNEGFSQLDDDQIDAVHAALDAGNGALPDGDGFAVQGFTGLRLDYAGPGSPVAPGRSGFVYGSGLCGAPFPETVPRRKYVPARGGKENDRPGA
jgi:serralysin